MPKNQEPVLRRTAVALVALAGLVVSGCGDTGDDGDADPPGVLSYDEIEAALLEEGSTVAGGEVGPDDLPGLADDRKAEPASCQPLSAIIDLEPEPVRTGRVQAKVPRLGPWVHVQLLTYAGDDAEEVFALVDAAVGECAHGFREDRPRDVVVETVVRTPAPELGDEATAYAVTNVDALEPEGSDVVEHMLLVRDGQQLLSFRGTTVGDDADAIALLEAVVDAQWRRYAASR